MNDQYAKKHCDICHELLYDGSPMMVPQCQHRYHPKCLPSRGEMNNIECPFCPDKNKSLSSVSTRETDEENDKYAVCGKVAKHQKSKCRRRKT